jgi:hypothetical protein
LFIEYPAVSVIRVLAQAEVGHDNEIVAELVLDNPQRSLGNAFPVERLAPDGVFVGGNAENDHPGYPPCTQFPSLLAQRLERVLEVSGH